MYGRNSYLGEGFCTHGVDAKTCMACSVIAEIETDMKKFREAAQRNLNLKERLMSLAAKWDSAEYAIEQVSNPLLPQEQCAIELRKELE